MSVSHPVVATPLQAHIPPELERLVQRARSRLDKHDKKAGVELLVDAYCDLIDTTLLELMERIGQHYDARQIGDGIRMANDVKAKAKHYVPWAAGFIAERRLPPVIHHFHGLMQPISSPRGDGHHIILPLSAGTATDAERILASLHDQSAKDLHEGIELLCLVVAELMVPLATEPKNLLNFNFVVNKPLDGVIALSQSIITRLLRQMGNQIPPDLYPMVAEHIGSFLLLPEAGRQTSDVQG